MKKVKIFVLMLVVTLFVLMLSGSTIAGDWIDGACGDNVKYSYDIKNKELIISGKGDMYDYQASTSPFFNMNIKSIIIEEGVKNIGDFLFEGCYELNSIVISDSVTSIGNRAFIDCDNLSEVVFPESIIEIEEYAFWGCDDLKDVVLPVSLETLGCYAFADNASLERVVIPSKLSEIKESTFSSCSKLKELIISGNVKSIGNAAFKFCFTLESVMLPESLSLIDECAFEYCYNLKNIIYAGSQTEWDNIGIEELNNNYLIDTNVQFNAHIHDYCSKVTSVSTCTSEGEIVYECSCGHTYNKVLNKKAHSYNRNITLATFKTKGKADIRCTDCGYVSADKVVYSPKTIKLSSTKCTYNGKVKTPSVLVKDSKGNVLEENIDYTVTYAEGRKLPGKYIVTVKFIGYYKGEKTLSFTIIPKTTSGVKAKKQTTSSITLAWSKTKGATGYKVYQYSPSKDKYVEKASVKEATYKVSGLKAGTTYKFKVKAYTNLDDDTVLCGSASSAFATATRTETPKLKSIKVSSGKVTLTWDNVSGESGYQVYYSTSKNGSYKKMKSVSADTAKYVTSKLTAGKTYYFKVRAYKKVDGKVIYGDFSDVKSVTIPTVYYITKTGKKYHVDGCRSLSRSKIQISYSNAVARGYTPCDTCII